MTGIEKIHAFSMPEISMFNLVYCPVLDIKSEAIAWYFKFHLTKCSELYKSNAQWFLLRFLVKFCPFRI